MSFAINQKT